MTRTSIWRFARNHQRSITYLFFLIFLCIGLIVFDDYGISWDEISQRGNGFKNLEYITKERTTLGMNHGPFFVTLLAFAETLFKMEDTREIFLLRHLLTFLLFYVSVVFFYLLCKRQFGDWKIGLLGSLFLILSPRIFADSFYNPKDLPFLSVFIISIYTLTLYLDKKNWFTASVHALMCAILIDIRVLGILVPCLTFFFFTLDLISRIKSKASIKNALFSLFIYVVLLLAFTILFWPFLWKNPIANFTEKFMQMKNYPWSSYSLYLGRDVAEHPPWHYLPVWIIITTPLVYIFSFLVGLLISLVSIIKNIAFKFDIRDRNDLIFILWFFVPLFAVIIFKSTVYNGWRHVFFIYPALLLMSLRGLTFLFNFIEGKLKGLARKLAHALLILLIVIGLVSPIHFMIKYHPHENVYFNRLAGKDMQSVKKNFELDYWGLSYMPALKYIVKNDPDESIKFIGENVPAAYNREILPPQDRSRLKAVNREDEEAKYFLSNYQGHPEGHSYKDEFYSIEIDGAKIMVVYKLNNTI